MTLSSNPELGLDVWDWLITALKESEQKVQLSKATAMQTQGTHVGPQWLL